MGNVQNACTAEAYADIIDPSGTWRSENKDIVRILMPVYYVADPITPEELDLVKLSWRLILEQTAPNYVENVYSGKPFPYESCAHWFHTLFYKRLFDTHPACRDLFKNDIKKQGELLITIILFILDIFTDKAKLESNLTQLAIRHANKGIKAVEYGIIGEVTFWTLDKVLGSAYTPESHVAWRKVFSAMLQVIIPVSIANELKSNAAQRARFGDHGQMVIGK